MGVTAIIVPVPPADAVVGGWRRLYTPSGSKGMPAHVTLLAPFAPPEELEPARVDEVRHALAGFSAFDFTLADTGYFDLGSRRVLHVPPEPAGPFIDLIDALADAFPDHPPYGAPDLEPRPHLTVATSDDDALLARIEQAVRPALPIASRADEVWVAEYGEQAFLVHDRIRLTAYDEELPRITVGGPRPLAGRIELREYDPQWARRYDREEQRIRSALGSRVLRIEHVGSTAVPGLAAKPVVDIVLEVADSADEAAYVPQLEAAGYSVRIREPDWFEHRVLKGPDTDVNLHVFPAGCPEVDRMLAFRDRLRADPAARERYSAVKRELAARDWKYTQQYADAKTGVIRELLDGGGDGRS